ncbi:MAG: HsdR family type I site-specific deoxyribonuclease [Candidatus Woesearchaeota archaeon]
MSYLGNEKPSVQDPLIQYACEVGWDYINPKNIELKKKGVSGLILHDIFKEQIQKLNPHLDIIKVENIIKKIEKIHANIKGNLDFWEYLKGLKTIYLETEKRERNLKLLDKEKNVYHITDEFVYSNGKYTNRYDIVFFVNGLPIFFVESKSVIKKDALQEGLEQVSRYHKETPEMMALFQFYVITNLIKSYYSATWNFSTKSLFEIKNQNFERLVKDFFKKENILNLLDSILFVKKDDELKKIILREHQIRAVDKIIERAKNKNKKRALIWHTQGSGKTYTMIMVAKKLLEYSYFENPTILMLVDRNELETQLFNNLDSVGFKHINIAMSKNHLKELLENDTRGLIISLIHKFDNLKQNINVRDNIFVLIDEAHRTTSGELGNYLMGALPNATYIGFTGTPIDKTSKGNNTFLIFGRDDPPKGYLDKYSISDSIRDGTTLKLQYAIAPNELLPDTEILEKEFLNMKETEGISDIDYLNKILEKAVNLKNMLKNRDRIKKVIRYIVDHYKQFVQPLEYKAFIVAVDREACALYKEEIDKYFPKEYTEVVYSPYHNDPDFMKKYYHSEEQEKIIRKNFNDAEKMPKILIVTEKLLTGFDAPILYCMYLDKPMRDHILLQAIARVNRPYEDKKGIKKKCGLIIDFIGLLDKVKKALNFDSEDITGIVNDLEILKQRFRELIIKGKVNYLNLLNERTPDKNIENILSYFIDEEKRKEFYEYYQELSSIYEIISPDQFLRPFLNDYDNLSRMCKIVKEAYEPHMLRNYEFEKKTQELVKKHVKSTLIRKELKYYEINPETISKLEKEDTSDVEKIFNLLKSIEKYVSENAIKNKYLHSIAEKAENISKEFKERQKNTIETLEELKKLVNQIALSEKEKREYKFTDREYTIFHILKENSVDYSSEKTKEIDPLFSKYPYFINNQEQERKLKQEIIKILYKDVNHKKALDITNKLLNNYKKANY